MGVKTLEALGRDLWQCRNAYTLDQAMVSIPAEGIPRESLVVEKTLQSWLGGPTWGRTTSVERLNSPVSNTIESLSATSTTNSDIFLVAAEGRDRIKRQPLKI